MANFYDYLDNIISLIVEVEDLSPDIIAKARNLLQRKTQPIQQHGRTIVNGALDTIYPASEHPFIADGLILPKLHTKTNLGRLYNFLTQIIKRQTELRYTAHDVAYYPRTKQTKELSADIMQDIGMNAEVVQIIDSAEIDGINMSINDIISAARRETTGKFDPAQWKAAVYQFIGRGNLITNMPKIFNDYTGFENDANLVMLVSGLYGEGLYILHDRMTIDGREMSWDQAAEIFAENPNKYISGNHENIARRIRLLFRKWVIATNQGTYIDRRDINPANMVQIFGASNDINDFQQSYKEELIRQGLLI